MTENAILNVSSIGLGPCLCGQVSIDGSTIAVGSPQDAIGNFGSIEVFVKPSSGSWAATSQPNAVLVQPVSQFEAQSFRSVAISGSTVVGVGLASTGASSVQVFTKPANGWNGTYFPQASLISTNPSADFSIGQVSISGNTVVGSSPSASASFFPGFVDVWVKPSTGWVDMTTENAQLTDGNITSDDEFGWSVAVWGNQVVVGAPAAISINRSKSCGAAFVYAKPVSGWATTSAYTVRLLNSDWTGNDGFGSSVAARTGTKFVGAPFGPKQDNVGAAYVFGK